MITKLSATPKTVPINNLVVGAPCNCPLTVKANKMPKPIYIPANMDNRKYPSGFWCKKANFLLAAP